MNRFNWTWVILGVSASLGCSPAPPEPPPLETPDVPGCIEADSALDLGRADVTVAGSVSTAELT
ncbi:MAG: hypothetical protein AB8H79_01210, partial [Myxococcota bacterium]